jgi:hypothetical protein
MNFALDNPRACRLISPVSAAEIIKELPELIEWERRVIRQMLSDIANQNQVSLRAISAVLQGAMMSDRIGNVELE